MIAPSHAPAPQAVLDLSAEARAYVRRALSLELDGTDATLPILDHYLGQVPRDPPEIAELVCAAAGCYFGELLRDRFGGDWIPEGAGPASWRLELAQGALSLQPMALAHKVISRGGEDPFDDTVVVIPPLRQALAEALERLAPLEEEAYYSLAGRFDALETIVDLVVALQREDEEPDEQADPEPDPSPADAP